MTEFHANYLDEDWEETTCCELGGMTQGVDTFWNYVICIQAKNSLLSSMVSHLDIEKLHHQIKAGMEELLSC
jgi:hypothetical protein